MKEYSGVVCFDRYNPEDWSYRYECFLVDGRDDHVSFVNERYRCDKLREFRKLLACTDKEAAGAAAASGKIVGTSPFLISVGKIFVDQIRAFRWRSVVDWLVQGGWQAMRICIDHGYLADYVFNDPVFENVNHYCVLHDIAQRIVNDPVPWNRAAARNRLREFFHGDYLYAVGHVLTSGIDHDLQLFLWDNLHPDYFVSSTGRCSLVVAFWVRRRDGFDGLCEALGIARSNALYEVFEAGCEDALPCLLAVRDPRPRKAAFVHAWNSGDMDAATALAKTLKNPDDRDFAFPAFDLAVRTCLRMTELEDLVKGLLVERMRLTA